MWFRSLLLLLPGFLLLLLAENSRARRLNRRQVDSERPVSQVCLRCLCEAEHCDWNSGCRLDVCGGFRITREYFETSNVTAKVPLYSSSTYQSCTTDVQCAKLTVQLFMQRLATDCDGDGKIDCDDFFKVHYFWPTNCIGADWTEFSEMWRRYRKCIRRRG